MRVDRTNGLLRVIEAQQEIPTTSKLQIVGGAVPELAKLTTPTDLSISQNGKNMYVLDTTSGTISSWALNGKGNMEYKSTSSAITDFDKALNVSETNYPRTVNALRDTWGGDYNSQWAVMGVATYMR
eukprot:Awhi_evm1s3520